MDGSQSADLRPLINQLYLNFILDATEMKQYVKIMCLEALIILELVICRRKIPATSACDRYEP